MTVSKAQRATDEHTYSLVRLYRAKRPEAFDSYPVAVGVVARELHVSVPTVKARVTRHLATIPWTSFHDMHSGGGLKEAPYTHIYIQAPVEEARVIFYNRFGHDPERVTCTCCGEDYSDSVYGTQQKPEESTLEQVTAYERNCGSDETTGLYIEVKNTGPYSSNKPYVTLTDYMLREDKLFINDSQIKPQERVGSIPETGWVWQG